jgi:hypothetical protein
VIKATKSHFFTVKSLACIGNWACSPTQIWQVWMQPPCADPEPPKKTGSTRLPEWLRLVALELEQVKR